MKDLIGREVLVGDEVVIVRTGYRDMTVGVVVKLTPKGMKVKFKDWRGREEETFRAPDMVCKVIR